MSSGQPEKPSDLDQVYAEAYRNYLRSLRDGLANLDIDALDLNHVRAPGQSGTALFTIGTPDAGTALFTIGAPNANVALFTIGTPPAGTALFTIGVPPAAGTNAGSTAADAPRAAGSTDKDTTG